jgi:hypothetical protein
MILMPSERDPSPELRWVGRKTARSPPEAVTLKFPCKYIRSPDEPLTAISETSDEVSKRPRGILPGSYTVHSLELDAAIAWGGVGVVAGVVTSITGGCFATGGGVGGAYAPVALGEAMVSGMLWLEVEWLRQAE